jgi:beta-lactamase superfamily II metal-dependent hydrolase
MMPQTGNDMRETAPQNLAASALRVRMYDVGFGDAFLLLIPDGTRTRKVLIDGGSIAQGSAPMADVVRQIVQDVTDSDGTARIDVVVMSHRHRDHVSGFAQPLWDRVEVQEVWMPWTEDPKDPLARQIREAQSSLAAHLDKAIQEQLAAAGPDTAEGARIAAFGEMAMNALSNEDAMRTLHEGFAGRPRRRFLPTPKPDESSFETPALPGVTIHILGPSRDEDVIAQMDPPAGRSYLRLAEDQAEADGTPEPFNPSWWVTDEEYSGVHDWHHLLPATEDRSRIRELNADLEGVVAATLEGAVNGTSLMLVLQVGKAHLLFPGDAQWGTWRVAMSDPDLRALMKRAVFYKIGHHGSHNATPKEFVEKIMSPDVWAMASTRTRGTWPIPKPELMAALANRTHLIARSDQSGQVGSDFTVKGSSYIECAIQL